LVSCSEIFFTALDREFFFMYLNDSFPKILSSPNNIFAIAPGFVDVPPIMNQPSSKVNTFVKVSLMDNGKTKWKMSENGVAIYYNTLTPIALMQYMISILNPNQFSVFYETVRRRLHEQVTTNGNSKARSFDLSPLPELLTHGEVQVQHQVQPIVTQNQPKKFCQSCGNKLEIKNGVAPRFCGGCGAKIE
jgi:hypothetical protein